MKVLVCYAYNSDYSTVNYGHNYSFIPDEIGLTEAALEEIKSQLQDKIRKERDKPCNPDLVFLSVTRLDK